MSGQGRSSSVVRLLGIVLLASVATCFCATRVFWTFDFARIKMLRGPVAAVDGSVEVPAQDDEFKMLAAPAALIARVRNESDAVQSFAFQVDGAPSCTVSVPPMTGAAHRLCRRERLERTPRSRREDTGRARFPGRSTTSSWRRTTARRLALLQAIVLPAGSRQFQRPPLLLLVLLWFGLVLLLRIEPGSFTSRVARSAVCHCCSPPLLSSPRRSRCCHGSRPTLVVVSPLTFVGIDFRSDLLANVASRPAHAKPLVDAATSAWAWAGQSSIELGWQRSRSQRH